MTYNADVKELAQTMEYLRDPWRRALRAESATVFTESIDAYIAGECELIYSVRAVALHWHRDPIRVFDDVVERARNNVSREW